MIAQGSVFYGSEVMAGNYAPSGNWVAPAPVPAAPAAPGAGMTIVAAIEALIAAKVVTNRRKVYINELNRVLRQFARGRENAPLESITAQMVEAWLAERKYAPNGHLAVIGRLATLFQFARRKRWIKANVCEEIERPYIDLKTPFILSVEQCEKLLRHVQKERPERLLYLTLCLHCGIRPNECRQLSPANITGDTIRIDAAVSKVRLPRIVHAHPTAALWLAHALPAARLPIPEVTRKRWVKGFARVLGLFEWPQDCARHTACSYWLAEKQDLQYIAMQLGNSGTIIMRHYRDLVSKETAAKFWDLKP